MMVQPILKPEKKRRSSRKTVPKAVMKIVQERSGGICEYCHTEKATDPHHICEIGMGGGNRIDIPINILHVCRKCHNHDDSIFIHRAEDILKSRIEKLFQPNTAYVTSDLEKWLETDFNTIWHQVQKGFLKTMLHTSGNAVTSTEDIKVWLGVSA